MRARLCILAAFVAVVSAGPMLRGSRRLDDGPVQDAVKQRIVNHITGDDHPITDSLKQKLADKISGKNGNSDGTGTGTGADGSGPVEFDGLGGGAIQGAIKDRIVSHISSNNPSDHPIIDAAKQKLADKIKNKGQGNGDAPAGPVEFDGLGDGLKEKLAGQKDALKEQAEEALKQKGEDEVNQLLDGLKGKIDTKIEGGDSNTDGSGPVEFDTFGDGSIKDALQGAIKDRLVSHISSTDPSQHPIIDALKQKLADKIKNKGQSNGDAPAGPVEFDGLGDGLKEKLAGQKDALKEQAEEALKQKGEDEVDQLLDGLKGKIDTKIEGGDSNTDGSGPVEFDGLGGGAIQGAIKDRLVSHISSTDPSQHPVIDALKQKLADKIKNKGQDNGDAPAGPVEFDGLGDGLKDKLAGQKDALKEQAEEALKQKGEDEVNQLLDGLKGKIDTMIEGGNGPQFVAIA